MPRGPFFPTGAIAGAAALQAVACGNQEWSFDDGIADVADAAIDAEVPDAASCGICGEGERCKDSACECLSSRVRCGQTCVALVTDPNHCGGCGWICESTQVCRGGRCD